MWENCPWVAKVARGYRNNTTRAGGDGMNGSLKPNRHRTSCGKERARQGRSQQQTLYVAASGQINTLDQYRSTKASCADFSYASRPRPDMHSEGWFYRAARNCSSIYRYLLFVVITVYACFTTERVFGGGEVGEEK